MVHCPQSTVSSRSIKESPMAITVKHATQVTGTQDPDADVSVNEWNEDHTITGTVDTAQIADGAVTSAKIADGTIVNADISTSAGIALSKMAITGTPNG